MKSIRPIEKITLAFLAAMVLLLLAFRHNQADWRWQVVFYVLLGGWVVLLAAINTWRPSRVLGWIRLWYPLILCVLFFENVGNLIRLVQPDWQDPVLIAADFAMFGVHPTVWVQRLARPWLNDLMQAGYTSYFFLSPALGFWLLARKQPELAEESMFGTALTYYCCYFFFILYPVQGPHHTLFYQHTVELTGGAATSLINWVEGFARVHGGAFPSAHVAGATVVMLYAWVQARRLFWILLLPVLCLYLATVYGRYHYVVDVWAGWLTAGVGFAAARCLYPRLRGARSPRRSGSEPTASGKARRKWRSSGSAPAPAGPIR